MQSNVIAFKARAASDNRATVNATASARDNVISLASWIGRAMPRRTPTGVFFTSHVLVTSGELA